jgi:DNA-binding NtrC family response regulator
MKNKLLVVDDEVFVRELLAEYFTKLEYHVHTAGSAAEALQVLKTEKFQAAVVDLRMPDANGIDLLRAIKQIDSDVSVVIMTGYPTIDSTVEALRSGAQDFVVKPFRLRELDGIIHRAVTTQQHRQEMGQLRERVVELEARVANMKRKEQRDGVEVGPRRFTIIEKVTEGEETLVSGSPRHRLRENARQDPLYEDTVASRFDLRGNSVSLLEESS